MSRILTIIVITFALTDVSVGGVIVDGGVDSIDSISLAEFNFSDGDAEFVDSGHGNQFETLILGTSSSPLTAFLSANFFYFSQENALILISNGFISTSMSRVRLFRPV